MRPGVGLGRVWLDGRRRALAGRSGRRLRHYLCASSAVKASRSRSCWRGVSLRV